MVLVSIWIIPRDGRACTAFLINQGGKSVVGMNHDWYFADGLILTNKRGVLKTAMGGSAGPLASWTSKFGSVTFVQYGRELVRSGMNEAGLFIGGLLLKETEWPHPDVRPSIRSAQWLQYQLDTASSVEEVIESDKKIRISIPNSSPEHFFVCDRSGHCAVIEFLKGKQVYRVGKELPVQALTNSLYANCVGSLKSGKLPEPDTDYSLSRFKKTSAMLRGTEVQGTEVIDLAFEILKKIEDSTQWTIVYDLTNLTVFFRTLGKSNVRHFSLTGLNFSCARPVAMLDIQADISGNVHDAFVDYSREANRDLIGKAFKKTPYLSNLPEYVMDEISLYPESLVCIKKTE